MVSVISSSQSNSFYTASPRVEKQSQQTPFSIQEEKDVTTKVTNENVWEEVSQKYDVRNATFEEMAEMAFTLHQAGAISVKEVALLTFDLDRATDSIKKAARQLSMPVAPNFSMYETTADEFGRRDWIAEFNGQAKKQLKLGNLIGHASRTKIVNILEQLEK